MVAYVLFGNLDDQRALRTSSGPATSAARLPATTAQRPDTSGTSDSLRTDSGTSEPTDSIGTSPQPDPGTLPQTQVLPTTDSPQFLSNARALWSAIVDDNPDEAMPFFFPKGAYLQVKAINNPSRDYDDRLVAAYKKDIHAWHAVLQSQPSPSFVSLTVPNAARWIVPGTESNKIGYFRVYGTQLIYAVGSSQLKFNVASMISWRGEWYVVHLAAIK